MLEYKNGKLLFKILSKLKELNLTYFIDSDSIVMVRWMGMWKPYHEVMGYDARLIIE